MPESLGYKNKVVLADYNYRKDIDNRLLMAELTVFEVEVIQEILNHSLQFPLAQLAEDLGVSEKKIDPVLKLLEKATLIQRKNGIIYVDKEMRKYYESQIAKFDDHFEPNIEFLQGILSKVPINALPNWYDIPCRSASIFSAIIENYLLTPKIYERYLLSLRFEHEVMHEIMQEVFDAPDFKICANQLIKKYGLTREQFEIYMLQLEYNFVCCLSYNNIDGHWEEVVTPFYEWRCHLQFERDTHPDPIENIKEIKIISTAKLSYEDNHAKYIVALRKFINQLPPSLPYAERDVREVERSLERVADAGWIYFDEFLKGFTSPLSGGGPVTLQAKGKKWKYQLPKYSIEDKEFVRGVIFDALAPAGVVHAGMHRNELCFIVTSFGRYLIDS